MKKHIRITTSRATVLWTNGGRGFSQEELEKAMKKLNNDCRVLTVEVIEVRGL